MSKRASNRSKLEMNSSSIDFGWIIVESSPLEPRCSDDGHMIPQTSRSQFSSEPLTESSNGWKSKMFCLLTIRIFFSIFFSSFLSLLWDNKSGAKTFGGTFFSPRPVSSWKVEETRKKWKVKCWWLTHFARVYRRAERPVLRSQSRRRRFQRSATPPTPNPTKSSEPTPRISWIRCSATYRWLFFQLSFSLFLTFETVFWFSFEKFQIDSYIHLYSLFAFDYQTRLTWTNKVSPPPPKDVVPPARSPSSGRFDFISISFQFRISFLIEISIIFFFFFFFFSRWLQHWEGRGIRSTLSAPIAARNWELKIFSNATASHTANPIIITYSRPVALIVTDPF